MEPAIRVERTTCDDELPAGESFMLTRSYISLYPHTFNAAAIQATDSSRRAHDKQAQN
jgi:hypothetical protein